MDLFFESTVFRYFIKVAFWTSLVLTMMVLFMIANFIFKIIVLDYRFDDGELKPPLSQVRIEHINIILD